MIGGKLRSEGLEILCGGRWGAGRAVGGKLGNETHYKHLEHGQTTAESRTVYD